MRDGVHAAKTGIEVIVVGFCTITQVMDRFHKKSLRLRKKAFIKECMDIYKSVVHVTVC